MADENNIGSSRLIGTNGLDQAVTSLTAQVNKMSSDIGKLVSSMDGLTGSTNKSMGASMSATNWNAGSNRSGYSSNGGGSSFSATGTQSGGRGNGGGSTWGGITTAAASRAGGGAAGGAKIMGVGSAVAGVASALTAYGNKNMSTSMQMNYFGTQSAIAGGFSGGSQGPTNLAMQQAFSNQYGALSIADAAQAAYTNQYTFGNSQFNGQANRAFTSGQIQTGSFAYANPTMGAAAAATAAQQTYTGRSVMMSQALGLASPIGQGGVKNSMSSVAQSMMQQTFGNQNLTNKQFNAAIQQGGSLNVNMQYWGQQLGWNQSTIQEYQGVLQGQVAAQNKGMSSAQYYNLLSQAQGGNKTAISTLSKTTGMGSSMFEAQRNLNTTQTTRQEDITQSLGPAFDKATGVVNDFSSALTAMMKATGLDKLVGTGAGWGSALSGGLSGLSGGFGAVGGALGAARLFGMAGGGVRAAGAATGMTAAAETGGAFSITSVGAAGGAGLLASVLPVVGAAGASLLAGQTTQNSLTKGMDKKYADTSTFNKYMETYIGKSASVRQAQAKQWFTAHPGASVDPTYIQLDSGGWKGPTTSGRSGGGSSSVVGNTPGNGSKNVGASASTVIRAAETQIGVPYVWGGESPGKGMDCSGLTQWAYGQAGVKIPRVAADQQKTGTKVATNATQPGDLLFVGNPAHHVVMSVGGGKVIEAPHTGEKVRIRSFSPSEFTSASRIVGSVGNLGSLASAPSGQTSTLNQSQSLAGGDIGALGGTSELAAVQSALAGGGGSLPLSAGSASAAGTSGSSPVGSTPVGNGQNDKGSLQAYAKSLLSKYGWGSQWNSFNALEMSEAGWNVHATNPSSGAYGLPQALPASKLASAGSDWQTNGDTQLVWMMDYIKSRYGSPDKAWSFHQKNNWYASGAWSIDQDQAAQVHKGEMILPAKQAETVRNAIAGMMTTGVGGGSNGVTTSTGTLSIGTIQVNLPAGYSGSKSDAQLTGKMIVDAITNDNRIKQLKKGQ